MTFFPETRRDSFFYLHIAAAVIPSPLTEARSSLGTELFTKMAVELKPHPVVNFIGSRITNNNGQRTLDLKKRISMSQICISILVSHVSILDHFVLPTENTKTKIKLASNPFIFIYGSFYKLKTSSGKGHLKISTNH